MTPGRIYRNAHGSGLDPFPSGDREWMDFRTRISEAKVVAERLQDAERKIESARRGYLKAEYKALNEDHEKIKTELERLIMLQGCTVSQLPRGRKRDVEIPPKKEEAELDKMEETWKTIHDKGKEKPTKSMTEKKVKWFCSFA